MTLADERVIELSKTKLLLVVIGACGFVAVGIWMLQLDSAWIESQHRFNQPALVHAIGLAAVAFFGLCALFGVKKLFETRPGLVLSSSGLFDNSSGIAAGLIPWSEIAGFDTFQVQSTRSLVVKVVNPEKYVNSGGAIRRALNKANVGLCGSPIAISSTSLRIGFDELLQVCNAYLKKYG